jgi:hypothetical protein
LADSIRATTPATFGEEKEVPLLNPYDPDGVVVSIPDAGELRSTKSP